MTTKTFQKNEIFELSDVKIDFKVPQPWKTPTGAEIPHKPFKKLLRTDIKAIFESKGITDPDLEAREIVAQVFPFKINQHIEFVRYIYTPGNFCHRICNRFLEHTDVK